MAERFFLYDQTLIDKGEVVDFLIGPAAQPATQGFRYYAVLHQLGDRRAIAAWTSRDHDGIRQVVAPGYTPGTAPGRYKAIDWPPLISRRWHDSPRNYSWPQEVNDVLGDDFPARRETEDDSNEYYVVLAWQNGEQRRVGYFTSYLEALDFCRYELCVGYADDRCGKSAIIEEYQRPSVIPVRRHKVWQDWVESA